MPVAELASVFQDGSRPHLRPTSRHYEQLVVGTGPEWMDHSPSFQEVRAPLSLDEFLQVMEVIDPSLSTPGTESNPYQD